MLRPPAFRAALTLAAAALAISGCRCDRGNTTVRPGEISLVFVEAGVTKASTSAAIYDFGQIPMGKLEKSKLVIKNTGGGALFLKSLEKVSGAAVQIAEQGDPAPVFITDFAEKELGAGEAVEFELDFDVPIEAVASSVHEAKLLLHAANTAPGAETAAVTFVGIGVSGECELPSTLDFGSVARGDSFELSVTLKNTRPIDATAFVGEITSNSGDDKAFAFTLDSPKGDVALKAVQEKTVRIRFSPTEIKDHLALVTMRRVDGCPDKVIKLIGSGVDNVLAWAPVPVDFGYVSPSLSLDGDLTFSNLGMKDVSVTMLKTSTADYKVLSPEPLIIPAATREATTGALKPGTAKVTLNFKPTLIGPRLAQLEFKTSLSKQPSGVASLKGYGGGPDIDVKPVLNFGRVAYFAGAVPPTFVNRKLSIQNVGTRPTSPDVKANLHLGAHGTGTPLWDVTVKAGVSNNTAELAELCVGEITNGVCTHRPAAAAYDPLVGLEASGTKAFLDVPVRVTPKSVGIKEWEVLIHSDDPDEPTVAVTIHADAIVLPPCQYEVSPGLVNFGLLTPPAYKDLSFTIKNLSQTAGDICLISSLDLKAGSDPIFSLPAGPIVDRELQPGAVLTVPVRAWPQGTVPSQVTSITGLVGFNISSPTIPDGTVSLNAAVAASCLTISPSDLNFGTVQKDCNSATRTFTIYNTCGSSVLVNSFSMISPAGQPAGGPNCAGASACPEFIAVSTAGIAPGQSISPGAVPVTFSLKYHPIDIGSDNGAFLLKVTQNGQMVDYVITLAGAGDSAGLNTDIFKQDSKPKADILLVIDNSCSMADKQMALSTNFAGFIDYARTAQVDYQIGVTSSDSADNGKIIGDATNPKVLKPTTPDVELKFKQKVNLGITGSGTEMHLLPAVSALTAPLITSDNVGLLRPDAVLAVVSVSDADDQSPQAVSFYVNQLLNIKGAQRATQFSFNVIGPFLSAAPAGCSYDGPGGAPRDLAALTATAGVREEICTPDWSKSLELIGKNAFGYRTNFFLTAVPDLTGGKTIDVKIDGMPMAPVDMLGSQVWTYDSTSNAVAFQPLFVPEPGETLTISYSVACIP
jgi:hypothetical protein